MGLTRLAAAAMVFLSAGLMATAGGDDTAKKLIGTWRIVKGEGAKEKGTAEFLPGGKLKLRAEVEGKEFAIDGTYKVMGKSLTITLTFGEKSKSEKATIKSITDKQLVVEDEKGKSAEFERVK